MAFRKPSMHGRQQPPVGAVVNWGNPVTRNLVCRLLFNESTNWVKRDIARNNIATASGGAIVTNGTFGKAVAFDSGTNGVVRIAKPLVRALPITLMGWIYNASASANARVLCIADEGSDNEWFLLYIDNSTGFAIAANTHLGVQASASGAVDLRNRWHHVVGVWASDSDRRVYVDGRLAGADTTAMATDFQPLTA
jgi:hypothetical protein